jgi:hypothetical protein
MSALVDNADQRSSFWVLDTATGSKDARIFLRADRAVHYGDRQQSVRGWKPLVLKTITSYATPRLFCSSEVEPYARYQRTFVPGMPLAAYAGVRGSF